MDAGAVPNRAGPDGDTAMRRAVLHLLTALITLALTCAPAHARPRAQAPPPLGGCGTAPPVEPGTTTARHVDSGGTSRSYLVHLPADYRPDRPLPVLLSFHGHTRDAAYQEQLSGFSGLEAIAVYPQGLVGTDGETAWQGAPYSPGTDDVRFTRDLLDQVQHDLCADPRRVYAAGKSNGGGFTHVLACRLGDRIAAFAPVAGAYYPETGPCEPAAPVPMISFHGTGDDTVPYDGDPSRGLPPIPDWLAGWARRDRCAPEPDTAHPQPGVTEQRWNRCAGRGDLSHYRIDGLGHDWPSRTANPDSAQPAALDATPLIWEFFQQHPLGGRA